MRDYSKVSPRFWTGETGRQIRKLGPQAQVVAFYLFTCPNANMLGLYYLALPTLCHETGSPLQGALKALRSLSEVGFAHYDAPSEYVYLPNMAREQIGERLQRKDNRHVAVIKELEQLRKTPFFKQFVDRYREAFELQDIEITKPLGSPSGGASEPLRSQDQDQDQDQDQKQEGRGRASRLPDDFALTPERRTVADIEKVNPDRTFAKFVDHWKAASGRTARKLDWDAAWRTWCRNEADWKPKNCTDVVEQRRQRGIEASWNRAKTHATSIGCPLKPYDVDSPDSFESRVKDWQNGHSTKRGDGPQSVAALLPVRNS